MHGFRLLPLKLKNMLLDNNLRHIWLHAIYSRVFKENFCMDVFTCDIITIHLLKGIQNKTILETSLISKYLIWKHIISNTILAISGTFINNLHGHQHLSTDHNVWLNPLATLSALDRMKPSPFLTKINRLLKISKILLIFKHSKGRGVQGQVGAR